MLLAEGTSWSCLQDSSAATAVQRHTIALCMTAPFRIDDTKAISMFAVPLHAVEMDDRMPHLTYVV